VTKVASGARLASQVCATEIIVLRADSDEVDLRCGGEPMSVLGDVTDVPGGAPSRSGPAPLLGKRYTDADGTVEVLVTKAGTGPLSIGDVDLETLEAKPLPSSD
jgi:hypothetical protein